MLIIRTINNSRRETKATITIVLHDDIDRARESLRYKNLTILNYEIVNTDTLQENDADPDVRLAFKKLSSWAEFECFRLALELCIQATLSFDLKP